MSILVAQIVVNVKRETVRKDFRLPTHHGPMPLSSTLRYLTQVYIEAVSAVHRHDCVLSVTFTAVIDEWLKRRLIYTNMKR